jgi:hypothetical protein
MLSTIKRCSTISMRVGLRHHRTKKNQTDKRHTLGHIRARDLIAFSAAIVVPMKPHLAKKGHSEEIVNRMYARGGSR